MPDITNVQVLAITSAPALGPEEVEQFITIPVENAMNGIPYVQEVRSFSQFGISGVTIVFRDGTDKYWARQQVGERLSQIRAEIPEEFGQPEMGPISTGLGEIFQFEVKNDPLATNKRSLMELRTILDWDIARRLKSVPGVVEVNAFGGELKTYQVRLDADRLVARGVSVNTVFEAIERNNANAGGGYVERNGEQRVIRAVGLIGDLKSLGEIVLDNSKDGTPIYVRDVADVNLAPMIRHGAVTRDGRGEVVTATVLMLAGENARVVVRRIRAKFKEIATTLPPGVVIEPYYDRADLIKTTLATVTRNLAEGGVLVVAVLLLLLGDLRAGFIVALAIPLSMLFAGDLMLAFGVAGSLMSLGALDFGLIVDSAVIVVENCVARLAQAGPGRIDAVDVIRRATLEVRKPVVSGVAIITLVHLPILALEGVEGKMFRPMALTVIFALTGSLLLSLTATPVLASFFLRPGTAEREMWPIRLAKRAYEPILRWALANPIRVAIGAVSLLIGTIPIALGLGAEFIPKLDEGDLIMVATRPPSASLTEALADSTRIEKALRAEFPDEIRSVVSRTGRPEIGIDPAGVNQTDVFIFLQSPRVDGRRPATKDTLIAAIEKVAHRELPGTFTYFGQPIDMQFSEHARRRPQRRGAEPLYGDDLDVLQERVDAIANGPRDDPRRDRT